MDFQLRHYTLFRKKELDLEAQLPLRTKLRPCGVSLASSSVLGSFWLGCCWPTASVESAARKTMLNSAKSSRAFKGFMLPPIQSGEHRLANCRAESIMGDLVCVPLA